MAIKINILIIIIVNISILIITIVIVLDINLLYHHLPSSINFIITKTIFKDFVMIYLINFEQYCYYYYYNYYYYYCNIII